MKKLSFLLLFSIIAAFRLLATGVSGPITSNTLWTVANSPYVVTGNILVMEGVTLTIQPGVEVRFDASKALQVNGTLVARGTVTDSIRFTSNTTQTPGAWGNVYFHDNSADVVLDDAGNYLGGCMLEFCIVEFGGNIEGTGVEMLRSASSLPGIRNCTLKNALHNGISIFYQIYDDLSYCFDNNCIRQCQTGLAVFSYIYRVSVSNCSFIKNECGISANASVKIETSLFTQNACALSLSSGNHIVTNNEFSYNVNPDAGSGNYIISLHGPSVDFRNNLCHHNSSNLIFTTPHEGTCILKSNIITDNACTETSGSLILLYFDNDLGSCPIAVENNIITNNSQFRPLEVRLPMNAQATFKSNVITNNYSSADFLDVNSIAFGASDTTLTTFSDNIITQNFSTSDVLTIFKGKINLNENSFYNNGPSAYVMKNMNSHAFQPYLDISNNYWGVETAEELSAIVYDFFDDANLGITMFDSILLAPGSSSPVLPPAGVLKTDVGNNKVQLSWLPNPEADIKGYNVYWGNYAGYTFEHMADAGLNTSFVIEGASVDDIIAVTAYDNDYISGKKSIKWLNENMLNGHESAYSFELHFPLSINEIKETADFSVYPVPASEKITIELYNTDDYSTLSIVNIQGQTLKTIHITNTKTELGIEEFTRGMYFIVLRGSKGISMKKVIRM